MFGSYINPAAVGRDENGVDDFGRIKSTNLTTLFQNAHTVDKEPLLWDEVITGGATSTYQSDHSSVSMQVSGPSQSVTRQTRRNFQYFKGKSQIIDMTFVHNNMGANVETEIGYGDNLDGLFFGWNGTEAYINRRTSTSGSAVDNITTQSNWNGDKLDGTGESGKTFDISKTQLLQIEFSWLGVNAVTWKLVIDGKFVVIHRETFTNSQTSVYMRQAILPLRYKIESTGAVTGTPQLECICQHVASEGTAVTVGRHRVVSTGSSTIGVTSTPEIVAAIRLKDENNRLSIQPLSFNLVREDNNDTIYWRVLWNPDLSNETVVWQDLDGIAEGLVGTETQSGGYDAEYIIDEGYIEPSNGEDSSEAAQISANLTNDIYLGAKIDGTADILALEVRRVGGGGTQDMLFVGRYREYF